MRRLRRGLVDHPTRSHAICGRILALDEMAGARRVMAFVGVRGEPDLSEVIARCRELAIDVSLPRVVGDTITPVALEHDTPLVVGAFGIPEATGEPLDLATIDVILVPGLAFTAAGARLGQGGGHFDRLLAVTGHALTVGVCFAEQLVSELPVEPHDRPVAVVVTDRATHRVGATGQTSS